MAWSIFTDGGGSGAAVTWAQDLLSAIGAPLTPGNEQFVFDWEVSEGSGGKFNPLNQGDVIGHPELTSTGSQYGGGAADYVSWAAGLQGAADYLNYSNYSAVKADLLNNNPTAARSALWASPWASSHYGYGSRWSNEALPGKASALAPGGGSSSASSPTTATDASWVSNLLGGAAGAATGGLFGGLDTTLTRLAILVPAVAAGVGLVVLGAVKMTGQQQHVEKAAKTAAEGAALA